MNLKLRLMSKSRDFSLHDKMGSVSLLLSTKIKPTQYSTFQIRFQYMVAFIEVY